MNPFKKLAGQTVVYGLSTVLGPAVNFLLIFFHSNKELLPVSHYGSVTEFYAYVAFLNILYQFGMETTYFRHAAKLDERKTYNTAFTFVFSLSLVSSGLLIFFSSEIASSINYKGQGHFISILALVLFLDAVFSIPFARLRQEGKSKKFATVRLVNIFTNVFLNIFFLVICKNITDGKYLIEFQSTVSYIYDPSFGAGYIFLSNLIANLLFVPLLWKTTIKGLNFGIEIQFLKELLIYSIPLVFLGLAQMVNEVIDRRMLLSYLPSSYYSGLTNKEALAVYGACYKFAMFMTLITRAFRYAAEPFFFAKADKKDAPETYALVLKWFIIATSIIYVGVTAYRYLVADIILRSEIYHSGVVIVPFLLLANLFLGVYYNQSIWYKVTDKTYWGTIITVIGATITIALNFLLIPIYGYVGSAIATLVCYVSISILSYIVGQKYYPVPYKLGSAFFYLISSSVLVVASMFLYEDNTWESFGTATGLLMMYLLLIYLVERKKLKPKVSA